MGFRALLADGKSSLPNVDEGRVGYSSDLLIVFAVVLCGLLSVIALNYIIKYLGRFSRTGDDAVEPDDGSAALAAKLRKGEFGDVSLVEEESFPAEDCSICLGKFVDGEKVRVLPECQHCFHVRCVDTWILSHPSCPLCRRPLLPGAGPLGACHSDLELGSPSVSTS